MKCLTRPTLNLKHHCSLQKSQPQPMTGRKIAQRSHSGFTGTKCCPENKQTKKIPQRLSLLPFALHFSLMLFRGKQFPWSITGSPSCGSLEPQPPAATSWGWRVTWKYHSRKEARKLTPDRRWRWTGILAKVSSQPRSKVRTSADSVTKTAKCL